MVLQRLKIRFSADAHLPIISLHPPKKPKCAGYLVGLRPSKSRVLTCRSSQSDLPNQKCFVTYVLIPSYAFNQFFRSRLWLFFCGGRGVGDSWQWRIIIPTSMKFVGYLECVIYFIYINY